VKLPFGLEISRTKGLSSVSSNRGGVFPFIHEAFAGAWQRNHVEVNRADVLTQPTVYACLTLLSSDIAKMAINLVQKTSDGIWAEVSNSAYSPVLRKPNHYQTRIQFLESWMLSKLTRGNAYILKVRDDRKVVTSLYVLDPDRVKPLISDDGSVFYEIHQDDLSGVRKQIVVPAREIIHDRMNCIFHPLVGVSPIFAAGLAAQQGLNIQKNSVALFNNNATPGGILTAPGNITDAEAERLVKAWEQNHTGNNSGSTAFLGNGVTYTQMSMTAVDAQVIDQLKWSAETVCSVFHVPAYKVGVGEMPKYDNISSMNTEYYSQALQIHIESIELSLDEGLGMATDIGTMLDIDALLRMDQESQIRALSEGVKGMLYASNEGRKRLNMPPKEGGDQILAQQQNFSLAALAKRDAREDPFAAGTTTPPPAANNNAATEAAAASAASKAAVNKALVAVFKELQHG
jgi:HK97 family phage portal protein